MEIKRRKKKIGTDKKTRNTKQQIRQAKRQANWLQALRMRQQGYSYYAIGREMGVQQAQAYQYVKNQLNYIDDKIKEETRNLRTLELTRLDRLLQKLVPALKSKDQYEKMAAVDRAIKIMDRRAKFIPGLNVPDESKIGMDDELRNLIEKAGDEVMLTLKRLAGEEEEG